jgi:hypothetical protein
MERHSETSEQERDGVETRRTFSTMHLKIARLHGTKVATHLGLRLGFQYLCNQ